jgi:hypothetical protein
MAKRWLIKNLFALIEETTYQKFLN